MPEKDTYRRFEIHSSCKSRAEKLNMTSLRPYCPNLLRKVILPKPTYSQNLVSPWISAMGIFTTGESGETFPTRILNLEI